MILMLNFKKINIRATFHKVSSDMIKITFTSEKLYKYIGRNSFHTAALPSNQSQTCLA